MHARVVLLVLLCALAVAGCAGPDEVQPEVADEAEPMPVEPAATEGESEPHLDQGDWKVLDPAQVAELESIAVLGEAVGEPEAVTTEEPCCSKRESQAYRLQPAAESELSFEPTLATVTCDLTCSGTDCAMVGCRPSPTFGTCGQFNCGLSCTGTCKQSISTGPAMIDHLESVATSPPESR